MTLLMLVLACGDKDESPTDDTSAEADTDTDTDTDADADADTDTDTDADTDPLRDLRDDLDNEPCDSQLEGFESNAGAARYYYGRFDHDGSSAMGFEQALLKATSEWSEGDCQVTWTATGTEGAPIDCDDCAYSLALSMELDGDQTDCPSGLVDQLGGDSYSITYNVEEVNGVSHYIFSSGTPLGSGVYNDDTSSYVTRATCMWF
jgi:hypothetical protein